MGKYYLLKFNLNSSTSYELSQYPNKYSFSNYKPIYKNSRLWVIFSDIDNIDNIHIPDDVEVIETPINFRLKIPSFVYFDKIYYNILIKSIFNI
jgi:hypothetical protein